jgi:outer membrane lipoprotein SlyB
MDKGARRSRYGVSLLVGLAAIVGALAGSASVSDRTAATLVAPVDANLLAQTATNDPFARANVTRTTVEAAPPGAPSGGGSVRRKGRCADCGVVESMTRVDRQETLGGVCSFAHSDRRGITENTYDGGEYGGTATLVDTVESVVAGRPSTRHSKIASSHRFVVRLRDGSRHVFDEATGRTLHAGERIQVIAGVNAPTR